MFNGFELTWKENQIGVLPSLIAWDEVVMVWHLNKIGTGCKHVCVLTCIAMSRFNKRNMQFYLHQSTKNKVGIDWIFKENKISKCDEDDDWYE